MATSSIHSRPVLLILLLHLLLCLRAQAADDLTIPLPPGRTSLADVGLYELHWQSYGQPAVAMPTAWVGHFDEPTGISYTPQRILGREALLIHSPWRVPMGRTWVTYHLALPQTKPIRLQFGIAMAPDAVLPDKGDGVTFTCQITADGQPRKLLGEHYAKGQWKDFDFDLSTYAGKTVELQLQVEPGPQNNAAFDYSYFGDAAIIVGDPANQLPQQLAAYTTSRAYQSTRNADLRRLGNDPARGIIPGNLLSYRNTLTQSGDAWLFSYEAEDCKLLYRYTPKTGTLDDFTVQLNDGRPFAVAAFGGVTSADAQHTLLRGQSKSIRQVAGGIEAIWQYGPAEVTWTFGISGKALTIRAASQSTSIAGLDLGAVAVDLRRPIVIPYLKGQAYYLPAQQAFACRYLDWTQSHASACPQGVAQYEQRTDGARNPLNEVGYIAISPEFGEVLPSIPHPPSPYLATLAGRVVLDVWGHHKGTFAGDAENLRTLKDWGVDHLLAITHQWQRYGYDVKLPDHLPADPAYGGDEGMKELGRAAREAGYLWALHENYIDLYPDAPSYDPTALVLMQNGKPSPAWYNQWTKVQSFGLKSNRALGFAKANSPEIHRRYGTTAAYLDVHTCVPPWHQLDHDAKEPMAAMALAKVQNDPQLFQFERDTHGGPLLGEGANQFYWAGRCDGVEGQVEGGEDHTPLLDFNLLKLHPQMVNHGMGYYERWFSRGNQTRWGIDAANLEQIDKYRAQQIAYGHVGFVSANSNANPWWVAREHHLMHPIQRLYGAAKASAIEYEVNGQLVTAGAALIAGDTLRQHITYDSGLQLWVNWRPETWTVRASEGRSYDLPQWGFLALGPDTRVMTCLNGGKFADYAQCPEFLFADARTWVDMPYDRGTTADVEPRLRSFEYLGDDRVRLSYEWIVKETIRPDLMCFVHAVNDLEQRPEHTVFQQDHPLPKPTTTWRPGETIIDGPYELRIPATHDRYDLRIGLYNKELRLQMPGNNDGTGRYTLATLHLQQANGKITSITAERPKTIAQLPKRIDFSARTNPPGTWADFGLLATDGAVKVERAKDRLILIPYPRTAAVNVKLDLPALTGISPDAKVEVRALAPMTHADLGPIPHQSEKGQLRLTLNLPNAGRYVVTWR